MTDLTIERLGHRGDGVAHHLGRPVFAPYTLPGEQIRGTIDGERVRDVEILEPSPDRAKPPCPYFGTCGGCLLQHLSARPYAAFKRQLVIDALADRGLAPAVDETLTVPPNARRRATFAGLMAGRTPLVGFNERGSHKIVPITECYVVVPRLLGARPALEALVALLQPRKAALDLSVTVTETGMDVALAGIPARDVDRNRLALVELAARFDLARLSAAGEVIVERRAPIVTIDEVRVSPPPAGFLQACVEAERAMAELVVGAVGGARRVADLYAGVGTFALPLARTAAVYAAEGDGPATAALDRAARGMTGRHRIQAEKRDLARRPLVEKDLERFDAVVFDPPRAGAAEQSGWLARSTVPTVVAVSCNPATLARDLRTLVGGGYAIERVVPIDQFLWSSHVEVIAVLRR